MFCRSWKNIAPRLLTVGWCTWLTIGLGTTFLDGTVYENLAVFIDINAWIILQNLVVLAIVASVSVGLSRLHPILRWSWFSLFKMSGVNPVVIPMFVKYFGLGFTLLVMVNLPGMARFEEMWFRAGTRNWVEGLYMSFLFGITHCLVGVPIGAGLAITIAGFWFTHQYFVGGIDQAVLHHTTYNLNLFLLLFFLLLYLHLKKEKMPLLLKTEIGK